ncbi:uncharacterized protein DFL_008029 [Arthrobotrys flagrans]|uniref:Uncharacterized protein n=1 Tax=Arthrobotrys flagrans TaxID=97331 RepID=A0A436ZMN8_ARTFL|nr:hypothetical protein DFL_008029 [Arthrobotrys flagrans]
MPNNPNDGAGDTLLGVLVTVFSILVVGLLALVSYLYFQLRKINRQYRELLQESSATSTLCQRIRERRKSAILHMVIKDNLEQQRNQNISSPISQHSVYSLNTLECGRAGLYKSNDITSMEPSSPETEPWAIRKVRSIGRLTGLTNELSMRSDRRDPFLEPTTTIQDKNSFYDQEGISEDDIVTASNSRRAAQGGQIDKGQISEVQSMKVKFPEAVKLEVSRQQISCSKNETQTPLAVPQTNCPTRSQSPRSATIISPSRSIQSSELESNIPPHAQSPTPQSSTEDPLCKASEMLSITSPELHDDNLSGIHNLEHYDTYEVPRPFLERSFSLNLAYSDPAAETGIKNRNSPGTKLKYYLNDTRNNRRTLGSTQGRSPLQSKSLEATISKAKRELFRLPKSSREENTPQPSDDEGATIERFQRDF